MKESLHTSKSFVARSLNGFDVYLNPEHTNMELHVAENPEILGLIAEAIEHSELTGDNVAIEKDLGRVVGETACVRTSATDRIIFARRHHRDSFSRFVMDRTPELVQTVVAILHKVDDSYELWSGWCGRLVPMVPDENGVLHGSKEFWAQHALVYDESIIQLDTITEEAPEKFI